ncbi:MAG: hypothetical protein ACKO15_08905, partial [Burkholderiales bacterium]
LHARIPLKLWMVTAIEGRDWQLVFTHNAGCNLSDQQVNTWLGRFCAMLVADEYRADQSFVEEGALSAENGTDIHRAAKAYIGVPLRDDRNQLIGALCGVDPEPDVAGIRAGEALVRRTATLLSRLLSMEAHVATQRMLVSKWSDATRRDELTGLLNRRGWDELMHLPHFRWGEELQGVIVIDIGLHGVTGEATNAHAVLLRAASALSVSCAGRMRLRVWAMIPSALCCAATGLRWSRVWWPGLSWSLQQPESARSRDIQRLLRRRRFMRHLSAHAQLPRSANTRCLRLIDPN